MSPLEIVQLVVMQTYLNEKQTRGRKILGTHTHITCCWSPRINAVDQIIPPIPAGAVITCWLSMNIFLNKTHPVHSFILMSLSGDASRISVLVPESSSEPMQSENLCRHTIPSTQRPEDPRQSQLCRPDHSCVVTCTFFIISYVHSSIFQGDISYFLPYRIVFPLLLRLINCPRILKLFIQTTSTCSSGALMFQD